MIDYYKITCEVIGVIGVIFIIGVVLAIPVYFLWNWLMPIIFGLPKVTIFQALGLSILTRAIFGCGSSKSTR